MIEFLFGVALGFIIGFVVVGAAWSDYKKRLSPECRVQGEVKQTR